MRHFFIISLFIGSSAFANIPAFSSLSRDYAHDQIKPIQAENMPRIASQDGLGICYACVAATMMQSENCRATKPAVGCENLPPSELFSQLDLTRIAPPKEGEEILTSRSSYDGLKLDTDTMGGDPHATAIIASLYTKRTANEACLSLDNVVNKMTTRGESARAQEAMWARMKSHYEKLKSLKSCTTCTSDAYTTAKDDALKDINSNLNLGVTNTEILETFAADTYDKFLDQITGAAKCTSVSQSAFFRPYKKVTYEQFPKVIDVDRKVMVQKFVDKAKEVLQTGRPLALAGICLGAESADNCNAPNRHASIIAGYRRVCNKPNSSDPGAKCRDVLKIVNCWGKSWQDENDGGWVDAETLLLHTKLQKNALGWFADK